MRVRARVSSQFPIKSLEVIVNGLAVWTNTPANREREMVLDQEVKMEQSGWLAVRCTSANSSYRGGPVFGAHSNPIYNIEIPGRRFDARTDAEYFLAWIDRLESDVRKRDRIPVGLDHVRSQFDAARAVYRRLASGREP